MRDRKNCPMNHFSDDAAEALKPDTIPTRDLPLIGIDAKLGRLEKLHERTADAAERQASAVEMLVAVLVSCVCVERVVSAVRTGSVERLRVNMSTTMWTKTKSSFFPQPMVFHAAPPTDKESATLSTESGFIHHLGRKLRLPDPRR